MGKKSPTKKVEAPAPEATQPEPVTESPVAQEPAPAQVPEPQAAEEVKPEQATSPQPPMKPKPLTMASLKAEVDELRQMIQSLSTQMTDVQSLLALKRKPTNNSKVQIRDKQTGKLYKSKNNVYQTMLKAGELKDLVAKGIFGDTPEKNTFGVYALFRAWPDRFEEVPQA